MITPVLTKLEIAKDATSITLQDTTGAYDVDANPGGYGTPNAEAPDLVGMIWRYWPDTAPYANKVITDGTPIAALLGDGHPFTYEDLGLPAGSFPSGVHHIKYYPLETSDMIVSLTEDSAEVTVTAGTQPSALDDSYKAVVILDSSDVVKSKVMLIDWTKTHTTTTLYLQDAWEDDDATGYKLMLATEADLKVLFTELAVECLAAEIGKLSTRKNCDTAVIDRLTELTMEKFASEIRFDCKDYTGAHNLIANVELLCTDCKTTTCKTCPT